MKLKQELITVDVYVPNIDLELIKPYTDAIESIGMFEHFIYIPLNLNLFFKLNCMQKVHYLFLPLIH